MNKNTKLIGTSLLTAIASSLCCITPILAFIFGASGIASTLSWLKPFRPYLVVFTILILSFTWYKKLKTKKEINCNCNINENPSFFQSKIFLGIVTVFAIGMTIFPYFSSIFYSKSEKEIIVVDKTNMRTIKIDVKGMTCSSCEKHINYAINQLNGILKVRSSYKNENTEIQFNKSKTTVEEIKNAINSTGYSVINTK